MRTKDWNKHKLSDSVYAFVAYKEGTGRDFFADVSKLQDVDSITGDFADFFSNAYGSFRLAFEKSHDGDVSKTCTEVACDELGVSDLTNPAFVQLIVGLIGGDKIKKSAGGATANPKG